MHEKNEGEEVDLLFPSESLPCVRSQVKQWGSPLGSHSCRYLSSFCLTASLFSLYSSPLPLHPFLSVSLHHYISLVSSSWPFAIVLCQIGKFKSTFLYLLWPVSLPSSTVVSSVCNSPLYFSLGLFFHFFFTYALWFCCFFSHATFLACLIYIYIVISHTNSVYSYLSNIQHNLETN